VFSYQDSLEFGIVVDREQLDDPWPLLDALRVGLDELRDLAQKHTPESPSTKKKATR
jgi:diacylglycerol O-acyltransferase / wax synthase